MRLPVILVLTYKEPIPGRNTMRFSTVLILLALVAVSGFIYVGVREPSFGSQTIVEIDAPVELTLPSSTTIAIYPYG